ncbi:MAG: ATP-binding protein [Nitrospirae bacterium]|nr:ATP-binding protein [Nitrospirota bacterium]
MEGLLPMMRNPFSRIAKSLAGKLIIALGLLIVIGAGISWYTLIDTARKNLLNNAIRHAASYSDLVRRSTRHSMLTFHREAIQHTLESIGSREDIKRIRIFDSKGRIFYSLQKNDIGQLVNRTSPACIGCHIDPEKPSITVAGKNQWTIYKGKEGYRILTFVDPIYNEPSCYTAACHAHPQNQRVLGILETDFSLSSVDENIKKQTIEITIYGIVLISISSILLYFILRKLVMKPVSTLSHAMEKVADGDLTQTVTLTSQDEMGLLAKTFNVMTKDLNIAKERMENWTKTLEDEIAKKTDELRKSQAKLIQAEKLASLGRLTADVAHEIRNPLTALGGFAHRLSKVVTQEKEKEYADVIVCNVNSLEKILRNVLAFSREARYHLERHNIEEVIHDVLIIYEDLCKEQLINREIKIEEHLPPLLIDREQVRQAFSNLITNAIDAMPHGGTLKVIAGKEDLHNAIYIYLKVSDTGQGIPEDKLPMIFEPFFTTKEISRGTGLGLSITRKILEEHGGFVMAESTMGKGSTFSLYFPYQSEEESLKIKCWEYMKCGRDKDATIKCPAYPNFGRICWVVAGTFCEGKVQGTFAQKYEDCKKCEFYQKINKREI